MDDHDFVLIPMEFWGISILGNMYMVVMMKNMIHMIVQYIYSHPEKPEKNKNNQKAHIDCCDVPWSIWDRFHL